MVAGLCVRGAAGIVEPVHIFSGNALADVRPDGAVRLPAFVRQALGGEAPRIVLGPHEDAPCLVGHGVARWPDIAAEIERRRLAGEAAGEAGEAHHRRARRAFGMAEEAGFDRSGRLRLPPLVRRRGGIGRLALFVGTGPSFEIWDPERAGAAEDETLREIAAWRLAERNSNDSEEETER